MRSQVRSQGDPNFNLAASIQLLVTTHNVPRSKITAGVAFYGRSAKTTGTPTLHAASSGAADLITFQVDEGTPLYYNVLQSLSNFNQAWDDLAKAPYLTGTNGLNTFVSYDNALSIELKAQHIVEQELRGAIIWEITGDYIETFPGSGVIAHTPLVNTLNDVFCNYVPGSGGTAEVNEEPSLDFSISPNPANESITVAYSHSGKADLLVYDSQGSCVLSASISAGHSTLSLSTLAPGLYHITLVEENGTAKTRKLVKLN